MRLGFASTCNLTVIRLTVEVHAGKRSRLYFHHFALNIYIKLYIFTNRLVFVLCIASELADYVMVT